MLADFASHRHVGVAGENLQLVFRPLRHLSTSAVLRPVT
jgi:hypothetical protein